MCGAVEPLPGPNRKTILSILTEYAVCVCMLCVYGLSVCVSVCLRVCLSVCVSACVDSYVSCLQIWLSLVVVQLTAPRDGNSIKMSTRARERESERDSESVSDSETVRERDRTRQRENNRLLLWSM